MKVAIDALPLLGDGGITSYVGGLVHALLSFDGVNDHELLFRTFPGSRRQHVQRLREDPHLARARFRCLRVPDSVLERAWRLGPWTSWMSPLSRQTDLFLATLLIAPWLGRGRVVPLVYDLIPFRFPQWYGSDAIHLERRLMTVVRQARVWMAISESTRNDLERFLRIPRTATRVVYPGVDEAFRPLPPSKEQSTTLSRYGITRPYVLYVGGFGPHKNVETLVSVFRRLKQTRRIPHQLVLCGRAAWGRKVVDAVQDLVATRECAVVDFMPAADLPHLYQGAEAFVFLSLYEGFGLPPLEAMASGIPVVVSNAGSLPEVVGDAALQVHPTDELAIEDAIYQVLTDSNLRQELRTRGFHQAARFSWREMTRQTLEVFAAAQGASG